MSSLDAEKSWVELCEEDERYEKCFKKVAEEQTTLKQINGKISKTQNSCQSDDDSEEEQYKKCFQKVDEEQMRLKHVNGKTSKNKNSNQSDDDSLSSENSLTPYTPEKKHTAPNNFSSYANILKSSPDNVHIDVNKQDSGCKHVSDTRKEVKRQIQNELLQEDISLSSHLDVFHVASPCKAKQVESKWSTNENANGINSEVNEADFPKIDEWSRKASFKNRITPSSMKRESVKDEQVRSRRSPRINRENNINRLEGNMGDNGNLDRVVKRRLMGHRSNSKSAIPDDVLMPSPSKIVRQLGNSATNSPAACKTPNNNDGRKRQREVSLSSPASGGSRKSTRKYERDPEILARRQKQIDYGKNTIGYERYLAAVPRQERQKNHPQTPPRHFQYSRRAWDGIIKVWRRRLHFWDPPSEGGGNPALLEDDDADGDLSSCGDNRSQTTNSVPTTPLQDSKRRKAKDSDYNDDSSVREVDESCQPLPVEDWLLMMEDDENEVEEMKC